MFKVQSISGRVAIGKLIGFAVGLIVMLALPSFDMEIFQPPPKFFVCDSARVKPLLFWSKSPIFVSFSSVKTEIRKMIRKYLTLAKRGTKMTFCEEDLLEKMFAFFHQKSVFRRFRDFFSLAKRLRSLFPVLPRK